MNRNGNYSQLLVELCPRPDNEISGSPRETDAVRRSLIRFGSPRAPVTKYEFLRRGES